MPRKDYEARLAYNREYMRNRREWQREYHREWRKKNRLKLRNNMLKYRYGVTIEELEKLGELCLICGATAEHVDHDHVTGKFRGLLCRSCNLGLGYFKDSTTLLNGAMKYLEQRG